MDSSCASLNDMNSTYSGDGKLQEKNADHCLVTLPFLCPKSHQGKRKVLEAERAYLGENTSKVAMFRDGKWIFIGHVLSKLRGNVTEGSPVGWAHVLCYMPTLPPHCTRQDSAGTHRYFVLSPPDRYTLPLPLLPTHLSSRTFQSSLRTFQSFLSLTSRQHVGVQGSSH
jgi:hypothetical protein